MTAWDLILAMVRRWYVVAVGAALTLGALFLVTQQQPVYWMQYNLLLVGPTGDDRSGVLDDPVYGLQPLVGALATQFNDGRPPVLTANVDATMVGQGIREGVQVRVPNLGTQWRPVFSANYLDVQVAGSSPEGVAASAADTNRAIAAMLEDEQRLRDVPAELWAHTTPSSADPPVVAVSGSRPRAAAATALTGGLLTVVVVYWAERRRSSRSRQLVRAT